MTGSIDAECLHVCNKLVMNTCQVEGCELKVRSRNSPYCEKHYMRMRRHGSTEKRSTLKQGKLQHSGGYLLIYAPDHPLKRKSCRVYEHRAVYYQHHGDGPFRCHWCESVVTWDDMHVDHLDDCKTNNIPENLVASCPTCNQKRGHHKVARAMRLRSHRRYTVHGKTMCLNEWAGYLGLSFATLQWRLDRGWPIEKVFSPRIGKSGPPSRRKPKVYSDQLHI
ncbi:HNH endonuclease [Xenorhabdus eapokensis]|uniref:Uncharacterized protein n=1 Tax=Xenorhabdus eapokensis TaxID=1873482 RepID=A0A1Q5TD52_9GAMM|nr:HNH endonuclease [Xenorhabdus eapokensis]OKO98137.1 hypothetical protein Xedl_03872 [Xenorhabdus eapokensis]